MTSWLFGHTPVPNWEILFGILLLLAGIFVMLRTKTVLIKMADTIRSLRSDREYFLKTTNQMMDDILPPEQKRRTP